MIRIAILDDEKADLEKEEQITRQYFYCLLYTSDAADE